ncbi:unnamed protein product [Auanema sp. JU1783]|nr:unnamed protein product [Auanema sp. JU1783]
MSETKERSASVDSDVSYEIIEIADCNDRLKGFLVRVAVILVVLGCCSGALIWSFEKGESGVNNGTHYRNSSSTFSIYVDEYTVKDGTYTVTFKTPDSPNNTLEQPEVYPSFWIQDNVNKRLVHKKDNMTTVFCYLTHAYWIRYDKYGDVVSCKDDRTVSYQTYIDRLGLANLTKEHSAIEVTHNHEKAYVYNGDPTDVIMEGTPQDAFLVTAYADAYTGALLGWDTYFTSSNISRVYQISYRYDSMTPQTPDNSEFDPPVECQPV